MPTIGHRIAQLNQSSDEKITVKSQHGQFSRLGDATRKAAEVAASDPEAAAVIEADVDIYGKENHAFVVIGRDPNSDPSRPETWGPDAYVVDAWAGASYQATGANLSVKMFAGAVPEVYRVMAVTDAKGALAAD